MATVFLSPTFGVGYQAFTVGGLPLNAGLIYTYLAGTTTAKETYTTSAGSVQNANPIVLGVDGRPPNEIWLVTAVSYKFVVKDSLGNTIATYDNITGINDTGGNIAIGGTLAVTGATTLTGDLTESGNASIGGTLAVTGVATLTAPPKFGTALVALGTGGSATLSTVATAAGTGPKTTTQDTWLKLTDSTGATFWVPTWK